jgi:adenosylcobyric acid synthase
MGITSGPDTSRPFAKVGEIPDGAQSKSELVVGTYMHGIFSSDAFRHAFLNMASTIRQDDEVEKALDGLAGHLEQHLDLDHLLALADEVR